MTAPLVLLVEDEPRIADIQLTYLKQAGLRTHHLLRGDLVVDYVRSCMPDLIVLDVMLPGHDGLAVCTQLRTFSNVPIIMVTARVDESDRLRGFEAGADDYLCKPFSAREMVARVQAQLRRAPSVPAARSHPLRIDTEQQRAYWKESRLALTAQQFRLLQVLAAQPGRIFSRAQLLEQAFPQGAQLFDRAIDSQIKNLRKKLAAEIPGEELIHSVYGVGYRFESTMLSK